MTVGHVHLASNSTQVMARVYLYRAICFEACSTDTQNDGCMESIESAIYKSECGGWRTCRPAKNSPAPSPQEADTKIQPSNCEATAAHVSLSKMWTVTQQHTPKSARTVQTAYVLNPNWLNAWRQGPPRRAFYCNGL